MDIIKETIDSNTKLVDKQYLQENENDHYLSEAKTCMFWKQCIF